MRYLQGEPGQMGRVRAIDRDLKLQKPQVKDVMAEFLPRNRLPLALYEIFPEFFDVESDERLKKTDTRGEGHAITLLATAPDITGEPVADWDPETERLGDAPARVEAEPEGANIPPFPRRYEGESTRECNQRLLKFFTEELPRPLREKYTTVEEMKRQQPIVRDLLKLEPVPRPPGVPRP